MPLVPAHAEAVRATTRIVGTREAAKNARAIVTGAQKYTLDLDLPARCAKPSSRAPPDIDGTVAVVERRGGIAMR